MMKRKLATLSAIVCLGMALVCGLPTTSAAQDAKKVAQPAMNAKAKAAAQAKDAANANAVKQPASAVQQQPANPQPGVRQDRDNNRRMDRDRDLDRRDDRRHDHDRRNHGRGRDRDRRN
jgi:hypothetical protein